MSQDPGDYPSLSSLLFASILEPPTRQHCGAGGPLYITRGRYASSNRTCSLACQGGNTSGVIEVFNKYLRQDGSGLENNVAPTLVTYNLVSLLTCLWLVAARLDSFRFGRLCQGAVPFDTNFSYEGRSFRDLTRSKFSIMCSMHWDCTFARHQLYGSA